MTFDYEEKTKDHYKDSKVAKRYHEAFASEGGLSSFRSRFIARRERRITQRLLRRIPHKTVIDIPAGTGKMAPVYSTLGSTVFVCDISEEMLEIAVTTYAEAGCDVADCQVVDLENASSSIAHAADALVCIRLMHRVPVEIKRRMLEQIAQLADHAIVSFGIDSRYQRARCFLRKSLNGGEDVGIETRQSRREIEEMLNERFVIRAAQPVSRFLSAEWIYLLECI